MSRTVLPFALALALLGVVLAEAGGRPTSTFARLVATRVDLRRLAALERAPTPLARRVVLATHPSLAPARLGHGGGKRLTGRFNVRGASSADPRR
jgi:hypothetical protein